MQRGPPCNVGYPRAAPQGRLPIGARGEVCVGSTTRCLPPLAHRERRAESGRLLLCSVAGKACRCSEMLCAKIPENEANSPLFSGWYFRRSLATRNHARAPWHVARLVYVTIRRAVLGSATMAHPPVRDRRARPSRAPLFRCCSTLVVTSFPGFVTYRDG